MHWYARRSIAEYNNWRKRAIPFAQNLAKRIDNLKGVFYPGCGFHYGKEEDIIKTLSLMTDVQPYTKEGLAYSIIVPVRLEGLASEVAHIERCHLE